MVIHNEVSASNDRSALIDPVTEISVEPQSDQKWGDILLRSNELWCERCGSGSIQSGHI